MPKSPSRSRRLLVLMAAAPIALLAACGGDDGGSSPSPTPPPIGAPSPTPSPAPSPTPGPSSSNPADQTVTVGQQALFHVNVAGATSYQWLRNGTEIPGATTATYQTPAVSAGDDNAKYTVRITTPQETTVSSAATLHINPDATGAPPASFWGNVSALPVASRVMTFSFVNRTNGEYADNELYWRLGGRSPNGEEISIMRSFAEAPTFDMPEINSARMYFFAARSREEATTGAGRYYDFIEVNIGRSSAAQPYRFNGNTTRVDAFGLKTAMRLRCQNGLDEARGEDYGTFLESRDITFRKYLAESPAAFAETAQRERPYRILEPGAAGFGPNGPNATYYRSYLDEVWAANGISEAIVPKPRPPLVFASNQYPDLEAAVARHVAHVPGTFRADGKLVDPAFWSKTPASRFYQAEPANFYARYWHVHGIDGKAYGFPYDDVGDYSTFLACDDPRQLVVAIGW